MRAGDYLVHTCPTWAWEGGDPRKAASYLPPGKQFLITRNGAGWHGGRVSLLACCRNRVAAHGAVLSVWHGGMRRRHAMCCSLRSILA